jgi:DNA-binding NarL/FixJ family response regulator
VAFSQLRELGEQAVAAVATSLVDGGAVLKAQLIASRFYEALRHELEESSTDDAKRAALPPRARPVLRVIEGGLSNV